MIAMRSVRVVYPIPPQHFFGDMDRRGNFAAAKELQQRFGSTFYHFDTTPFVSGDTRRQQDAIANLRAYRPHLAISNSNSALLCAVKSDSGRANVFTDILKIPLMMLWDHGLFAFPALILSPLAERAEDSCSGSLRRVSEVIDTTMMHHFPIDNGQVAEMYRIGMMHSDQVQSVPALAFKPFLDFGLNKRSDNYINDVAFVGNVMLSDRYRLKVDKSIAGRCREAVVNAKMANPSVPAWNLLAQSLGALSSAERTESRLDYDHSFFWNFANDVVGVHCNRQGRMQVLDSLRRKVAFYGEFAYPEGVPRLKEREHIDYKGYVHYSSELPQVYAGTRIVVDVTNAAFITNCSNKPICCFASGGFALFDQKPDPVRHLGNDVEKVMYRTVEELNAKIDYFLTNERERQSLADHLKDVIRRKCSFADSVCDPATRILAERAGSGVWSELKGAASRVFGGMLRSASVPLQLEPVGRTRQLADIVELPEIMTYSPGAALLSASPLQIRTSDVAWGYSALFPIPKYAPRRCAHGGLWIQVRVRMISGRAGIGLLLDDNAVAEEHWIGTEHGWCTLSLPLSATRPRGLLIRSAEVPSSTLEVADIALVADERFRDPEGIIGRLGLPWNA